MCSPPSVCRSFTNHFDIRPKHILHTIYNTTSHTFIHIYFPSFVQHIINESQQIWLPNVKIFLNLLEKYHKSYIKRIIEYLPICFRRKMGKFNVQAIRFLDAQHFRVLTSVEMGMKNHELVGFCGVQTIFSLMEGGQLFSKFELWFEC